MKTEVLGVYTLSGWSFLRNAMYIQYICRYLDPWLITAFRNAVKMY